MNAYRPTFKNAAVMIKFTLKACDILNELLNFVRESPKMVSNEISKHLWTNMIKHDYTN